ncbi:MAG: efflux RND transporter periplasmic adaptor subunit [Limisphaerales bacterium]|jgi:HlyD family secretion protein|nr:efflux RND transporter periplasmic adaptor subunit [Verrucomicrobiota bacterium]
MKRRKKGKVFYGFCALALLAIVGSFFYYSYLKREKPIEVQVGLAQKRDITEIVIANGKVQPVTYVKISPEVSGEIIELPVKEGQKVNKGDLLFSIKPDLYIASSNSAAASLQSALGSRDIALYSLEKWQSEWERAKGLFQNSLLSQSDFDTINNSYLTAQATYTNSLHQVTMSQAALDRASEDLSKCIIFSPLDGTVSKLNSELGERVVGTGTYTGTEVMTISDLNHMEARVEIGEMDINLIKLGQKSWLEVDAFRDRKFAGTVTQIANSASGGGGTDATKFEVRILIQEKEAFRPGMSVTAEVETRYRTNVLSVPIQAVSTRMEASAKLLADKAAKANPEEEPPPSATSRVKKETGSGIEEVVFVVSGNSVLKRKVERGISDDNYTEITSGLQENEELVIGGYKAISKDLDDGKLIKILSDGE